MPRRLGVEGTSGRMEKGVPFGNTSQPSLGPDGVEAEMWFENSGGQVIQPLDLFTPWLEVTFSPLKGSSFHHPKKVTNRIIATGVIFQWSFFFELFVSLKDGLREKQ